MSDDLMEKLADIEHDRWSRWHSYARHNWTPENIARWDRQANTAYKNLSDKEKESDRREVRSYYPIIQSLESETAALRRERDELTAKLDEANGVLTRAGYTLADGASAWKPPVNKENGALWQRVFDAESKLQAAEKELSRLNELEKKFAPVAIECELLEDDKKRLEASLAHRTAALEEKAEEIVGEILGRLNVRGLVIRHPEYGPAPIMSPDEMKKIITDVLNTLSDSPSAATEGKSDKPEAAGRDLSPWTQEEIDSAKKRAAVTVANFAIDPPGYSELELLRELASVVFGHGKDSEIWRKVADIQEKLEALKTKGA